MERKDLLEANGKIFGPQGQFLMGGLVAGAYASGMSPADIRALMKDVDWGNMFLAVSPYTYKTFRRKQDSLAYPSQLRFGLKGGFKVPKTTEKPREPVA